MGWHFNPQTGIWDKYADNPLEAQQEIRRINTALSQGKSIGGASPEYGQTLATLLLLPIGVHAGTTAILGATAARTAAGAAAGATAGASGLGAAGAITGASLVGLATTGAELGFDVYLLNWLKENWWIPALLIGAYMGVKLIK
jgi:hypothetical protein